MNQKQKILDFIKSKKLAVISTINSGEKPQSAVVAFSETKNLEIIFGTFSTTRKYKNLQENKNVSIVIGWDEAENITVQYEGTAEEVKGKELETCREIQLKKNPSSRKYAYEKEQRYFKIKPTWIRYSDFSKEPEEIFNIVF
jgi:pyridoxine/pyridoxamine 5'-phosphate oxidase